MLLLGDREKEIPSSEITPRATFEAFQMNRRSVMAGLGAVGLAAALPRSARAETKIDGLVTTPYAVPDRATTPEAKAKSYNNFYEFGEDKSDPAKNAYKLRTYPWNVSVEGLVGKPRTFQFGELYHLKPMQSRVYRFRCVEAWSMVIPGRVSAGGVDQSGRAVAEGQVYSVHFCGEAERDGPAGGH
jgi:sulfoxide reductase catalytic subunit YedY